MEMVSFNKNIALAGGALAMYVLFYGSDGFGHYTITGALFTYAPPHDAPAANPAAGASSSHIGVIGSSEPVPSGSGSLTPGLLSVAGSGWGSSGICVMTGEYPVVPGPRGAGVNGRDAGTSGA